MTFPSTMKILPEASTARVTGRCKPALTAGPPSPERYSSMSIDASPATVVITPVMASTLGTEGVGVLFDQAVQL